MDYTRLCMSPLGAITLASDGDALTGLWFDGQKHFAAGLERDHMEGDNPVFHQAEHWLEAYFRGADPGEPPPLRLRGTDFQRDVWALLLAIPRGRVTTYGRLADALARQYGRARVSARAVGGAVGRNPVSLIVPCHRVVGADGGLTGYAGGVERKEWLLRLERADRKVFFTPR